MGKHFEQMKQAEISKGSSVKVLTTVGSSISIVFGIWHFFVPAIWNWYSYIDEAAPELVIAVRAINIFFSLLLVLLGVANILLVFKKHPDRLSTIVILLISLVLWFTRVILQLIYPQGSQNLLIQYSMLIVFVLVLSCFTLSVYFLSKHWPKEYFDNPESNLK